MCLSNKVMSYFLIADPTVLYDIGFIIGSAIVGILYIILLVAVTADVIIWRLRQYYGSTNTRPYFISLFVFIINFVMRCFRRKPRSSLLPQIQKEKQIQEEETQEKRMYKESYFLLVMCQVKPSTHCTDTSTHKATLLLKTHCNIVYILNP